MRNVCRETQLHREVSDFGDKKSTVKNALRLMINVLLAFLVCAVLLCGCAQQPDQSYENLPEDNTVDTGFVIPKAGTYDSADTDAVVVSIDKEAQTCTLYNRLVGKNYTLNFDGTSKIYDKYKTATVIDQIKPGDLVDVTFLKSKKLLNSMTGSQDVWIYDDVTDFEIDPKTKHMKINGGDYRFSDDLFVFLGDKKAQLMDINSCDVLKICGTDHDIYSIVITKGHGYLRIKGQHYFEGGWIEVGNKIIKNVTRDMLIAVPVGRYRVKLSNGEYEGSREVVIESNCETELDVSDMVVLDESNTMYGNVILVTEPAGAQVYVDGKEADASAPLNLEYGIHQLIVRADGYESMTQYIKVGQENATLEITLDKKKDYDSNKDSSNPQPSPSPQVTTYVTEAVNPLETSDYRVMIESPEGAEVYIDGSYVGIVPVDFAKREGTHVVTLRKEGCVTRSYTISLDGVLRNETFSFASLEENE